MLLLSGCRGGSSSGAGAIATWQRSVEQYIVAKNNDPDALREVTLDDDSRRGFSVLGGLDPRKTTDERALLLAHKPVGNRPWFIYLVGVVKKDVVQDIRLVALSAADGQTVWRVGGRNPRAFKQYRDAGLNEWRQRAAGAGDRAKPPPPPQYTTFPRASDVFDVAIDGTIVRATHAASGAVFTVDTRPAATLSKDSKQP
jgi:hypothetical protein